MTNRLAVMGNPIAHSMSPMIHQKFAQLAGIDLSYEKILVPEGKFAQMAEQFFNEGGIGLNVTVPHKFSAYEFAQELSDDASLAQAVNTLQIVRGGKVRGENTDGFGLLRDLTDNLGWLIAGRRVLILGAGGAVQGVLKNLVECNPATIVIANRTLGRAQDLINNLNSHQLPESSTKDQLLVVSLEDLPKMDAFDLIISASSAGLDQRSEAGSFLGGNLIHQDSCCYDMIYGKSTPFLAWANQLPEAQSADGLGMLVEQAAKSFELWFGCRVETQSVLDDLRKVVGRKSNK